MHVSFLSIFTNVCNRSLLQLQNDQNELQSDQKALQNDQNELQSDQNELQNG